MKALVRRRRPPVIYLVDSNVGTRAALGQTAPRLRRETRMKTEPDRATDPKERKTGCITAPDTGDSYRGGKGVVFGAGDSGSSNKFSPLAISFK